MKTIPKYSIIALSVFVFFVGVYVIIRVSARDRFASFYPQGETTLVDMEVAQLHLKEEWFTRVHLMRSILAISAERIFIFQGKHDTLEIAKKKVGVYLKAQADTFANTSQATLLEDIKIFYEEDYYIVVVSARAPQIMKEIKGRIHR